MFVLVEYFVLGFGVVVVVDVDYVYVCYGLVEEGYVE